MPLVLRLWRQTMRVVGPFVAGRMAAKRRTEGAAEARLGELRGVASQVRPEGALIWFHAASVGESLSLLPLIEALQAARPRLSVLVTTVTPTSAEIMAERLPEGALHQFAPVDAPRYLRRFRRHWRPGLVVVVESEIWPVMLDEIDRAGIPRALVNARLSDRSLGRWGKVPAVARALFAPFGFVSAQTEAVARTLTALGARNVRMIGNLKAAASAPPADAVELARLREMIGTRPVWAAISTHDGEEATILAAHKEVRRALPEALLILCPRHPARGDGIAALAPMTRRSQGGGPEGAVWLADTLGETGLWYRLASVTFLGGSLVEVGGHNPWEAALSGTALLHGPLVANAQAAWDALDAAGAARVVDAATLGEAVTALLAASAQARNMAEAGHALAFAQERPAEETATALLALMESTGDGT